MERDGRVWIVLVVGMLVAFPVASTAYSGGPATGVGAATGYADSGGERLDGLVLDSVVLDGVVDAIEELDRVLEAVVDLLRTVERLFGAGEGGGD